MKGEHEFNLRMFIKYAEKGDRPPKWLVEFMAEGAREFLRGGKPWQNGKGGRPGSKDKKTDIAVYLLRSVCELTREQIVDVLKLRDEEGTDKSNTVRGREERGEKNLGSCSEIKEAFLFGSIWPHWRDSLDALLNGDDFDFDDCPECKNRLGEFRDTLNRINAELDQEPRYD